MHRCNASPGDFAAYLQSMVQLNAIETMTQSLDEELSNSQKILQEIKVIFDSVPSLSKSNSGQPVDNGLVNEDISKFLEVDVPNLLMPDMVEENSTEIDLDDALVQMKGYIEELKKNTVKCEQHPYNNNRNMVNLDLEKYVTSLNKLSKRLANIKLNKKVDGNNKNSELEAKLQQLCQDVHMFTQMVQAKATLSETNKNWAITEQDNKALQYDTVINKLLSGINEATYLLQNKNCNFIS